MTVRVIDIRGLFAATALALLVCPPAQAQANKQTYTSPLGNFSVSIPDGTGQRVQHEHDKDGGIVAFHDDFGNYRSIFYLRLSPRSLELQKNTQTHRPNLERFLNEYAMTWLFKPASPRATVLHTEHLEFANESAYFAMVNLPEGSTMFDVKANKRHSTKRGFFVFTKGSFIYMVGSGENPSVLELGNADKPLATLLRIERARLLSFISTIRFN